MTYTRKAILEDAFVGVTFHLVSVNVPNEIVFDFVKLNS